MAFPTIVDVSTGVSSVNSFTHTINMPANVGIGQLILVCFTIDATPTASPDVGLSGSNWIQVSSETVAQGATRTSYFYKIAEGGDTLTLNSTDDRTATWTVFSIDGAESVSATNYTSGATTSVTSINPPSHTPPDGEDDYLWLVHNVWCDGDGSVTGIPTGYATESNYNTGQTSSTLAGVVGVYSKSATASSEDPSAITYNLSRRARGAVLAVKPLPPSGSTYTLTVDAQSYTVSSDGVGLIYDRTIPVTHQTYTATFPDVIVDYSGTIVSETQAWLDELDTPLDEPRTKIVNTFIRQLIAAGIWDNLDSLYIFALPTSQASRLNVKSPTGADAELTVVGSPIFTPNVGWNGNNNVGNRLAMTSTLGSLTTYSQDAAHIGVWVSSTPSENAVVMGADTYTLIVPNYLGANSYGRLHRPVSTNNTSGFGGVGHHLTNRGESSTYTHYKNGSSVSSAISNSSNSIAMEGIISFCNITVDVGADPSNATIALGHVGLNLSGTQISNFYTIANQLLTDLAAAPEVSTYTLSLDTQSFTLTNNDVELGYNKFLPIDLQTFTITNNDINLQLSKQISIDTQSYSITNNNINFELLKKISVNSQTYELSLQDISFNRTYELPVSQQSYNITLNDVELNKEKIVSIDTQSYSITNNDVELGITKLLSIDVSNYNLSLNNVSFNYNKFINVDTQTYNVNTEDVIFDIEKILNVQVAVYVIEAYDILLTANKSISVQTVEYDIENQDVLLYEGQVAAVFPASFEITPSDITLKKQFICQVSSNEMEMTFEDIDLRIQYLNRVILDTAEYATTFGQVNVKYNRIINVSQTQYDLSLKALQFKTAFYKAYKLIGYYNDNISYDVVYSYEKNIKAVGNETENLTIVMDYGEPKI